MLRRFVNQQFLVRLELVIALVTLVTAALSTLLQLLVLLVWVRLD